MILLQNKAISIFDNPRPNLSKINDQSIFITYLLMVFMKSHNCKRIQNLQQLKVFYPATIPFLS